MVNGKPVDIKTLARIVNDTEENIKKYLDELERFNVFSRLKDGTIICRRMFRESRKQEEMKQKKSKAGKIGMSKRYQKKEGLLGLCYEGVRSKNDKNTKNEDNSELTESYQKIRGKSNNSLTEDYQESNTKPNREPNKNLTKLTPSFSFSSSFSISNNNKNINKVRNQTDDFGHLFEELWKQWPAEGRFKKKFCRMKFIALCKAGKLEEFKKTATGYSEYLKHKKINEGFDQRPMHLSTFLNNWEEEKERYIGFEYRPKL